MNVRKYLKDSHFKEILVNSGFAFILRVAGLIVSYLFTMFVTRKFGAGVWGIFAIFSMCLQIVVMFGRLGMDLAVLRLVSEFISFDKGYLIPILIRKVLMLSVGFSFGFSLVLSAIFFFCVPYLSNNLFHNPLLMVPLKLVSLFVVPFAILWIVREILRGLKKIVVYMVFQQLGLFGLGLLFLLLFEKLLVEKFIILPVLSYGFSIVVLTLIACYILFLTINKFSSPLSSSQSSQFLKVISYSEILSLSLPLFFSSVFVFLMGWTDTFMLGVLRNTKEVGIYNVALKISMIISIILFSVNSIAAPKFAEFWGKREMEGLSKVARQSSRLIFWASFPILLMIIFYGKQILKLFGSGFEIAFTALLILSFGQFINAIVGSVGYILMMTGKEKVMRNVIFVGTVINVVLNFILIPSYGISGAAAASAVSLAFINIVPLILIKKYYGFYTINII